MCSSELYVRTRVMIKKESSIIAVKTIVGVKQGVLLAE